PAAARRRAARVLRTTLQAPPATHVALGHRAQDSVPKAQSAPSRHRLTPASGRPQHQAALRPRPRSQLPAYRDNKRPRPRRTTRAQHHQADNLTIALPDRRARAPSSPRRAYCTFRARVLQVATDTGSRGRPSKQTKVEPTAPPSDAVWVRQRWIPRVRREWADEPGSCASTAPLRAPWSTRSEITRV